MTSGGTMPMFEEKPLLILIDGNALVHRAWHAIRQPLNLRDTAAEGPCALLFYLIDWSST